MGSPPPYTFASIIKFISFGQTLTHSEREREREREKERERERTKERKWEREREKERTKKACPANYNRCQKLEVFKKFCE